MRISHEPLAGKSTTAEPFRNSTEKSILSCVGRKIFAVILSGIMIFPFLLWSVKLMTLLL